MIKNVILHKTILVSKPNDGDKGRPKPSHKVRILDDIFSFGCEMYVISLNNGAIATVQKAHYDGEFLLLVRHFV